MKWFWLSPLLHPGQQRSPHLCNEPAPEGQDIGCVAEVVGCVEFSKAAQKVRIRACADAAFELSLNGRLLWMGPAAIGNDFLPYPEYPGAYYDECVVELGAEIGEEEGQPFPYLFSMLVRSRPLRGTELSSGTNGFTMEAEFLFADGSVQCVEPDETWRIRVRPDYVDETRYNGRISPGEWEPLHAIQDVWKAVPTGIPVCRLASVEPLVNGDVTVPDGSLFSMDAPLERIHLGYLEVTANAPCRIVLSLYEKDREHSHAEEEVVLDPGNGHGRYRSLAPQSIGGLYYTIHDLAPDCPVSIRIRVLDCAYPVTSEGSFRSSDKALDKVYDLCKWTLRICRQSMHLDSPKHQEPLACTGDYYIESLMTAFTFGDMRLAALDVRRTARNLDLNEGRMFHTTYSLLWVRMLRDVYFFTGEEALLRDCISGLEALLKRFQTYVGNRGVLETPPDYMFVDWVVTEGFSMHHPPKALGQTVLNAYYYGALCAAAEVFDRLNEGARAEQVRREAEALKAACNALFYDAESGYYVDGCGDEDEGKAPWRPANPVGMRHFSRYPNVLAVLYGLQTGEAAKQLLRRTLTSDFPEVQPYFMHFVLEAIAQCGLFAEFGMEILQRWVPMAEECMKGLKEGWFAPEANYSFDYSHAWGGTPAYQLPAKLLGFRMVEPGFRKISLRPKLYGLQWAEIEMPTPYGMLRCHLKENELPRMEVPEGIAVER